MKWSPSSADTGRIVFKTMLLAGTLFDDGILVSIQTYLL